MLRTEDEAWTLYSEHKPDTAGVYLWRVPSVAVPGLSITFYAHMRKRGAGYEDIISPLFDYWDGYRVHVPAGTEWQPATEPPDIKWHDVQLVDIGGLENAPCPYCGKVPTWHATIRSGNGTLLSSDPHRLNNWWLECCAWGHTPHRSDPRELTAFRNVALAGKPEG